MVTPAAGTTILDYCKLEISSGSSTPIYSKIREMTPFYINSITVDTSLNYKEYPFEGNDYPVLVLGMNERTCTINGSFQISSTSFANVSSVPELKPYSIRGGFFIRKSLISYTGTYAPIELSGYWRIDNFAPDRNAEQNGKPDFTLVLKYSWDTPGESLLFKLT